ncbi:hypothetical protein L2E82_06833 [Cichorium intybus]|uniref:Uncharacterized protein n=1 Tax=Cichorium intybus TaxID=13427 RepID=A0ACB9HAM9_CICIN|nr:hypothetical protein L2E82_06833 [Cichorium intybus]
MGRPTNPFILKFTLLVKGVEENKRMLCSQVLWRLSLHCRRSPLCNTVLRHLYASLPSPPGQMGKAANCAPKSSLSITKDDAYLQSVIPKRIELFESIKAQQIAHRQSISGDPIKVTLPDGTVKDGKKCETTPFDIAKEVSKSLASNCFNFSGRWSALGHVKAL